MLTVAVGEQTAETGEALVGYLADAARAPADRLYCRRGKLLVRARHVRLELAQHRRDV